MFDNMDDYKCFIIYFHIHIVYFIFFPVPCVENDIMPYCNYILYFYILSWWPYDSGKPIPVLVRSPWDKVDLSGFTDKIP